jgi:hypothetical protein
MNGLTRVKTNQRLFSERMLATFDGNTPGKVIYIAVSSLHDTSFRALCYIFNFRLMAMFTTFLATERRTVQVVRIT